MRASRSDRSASSMPARSSSGRGSRPHARAEERSARTNEEAVLTVVRRARQRRLGSGPPVGAVFGGTGFSVALGVTLPPVLIGLSILAERSEAPALFPSGAFAQCLPIRARARPRSDKSPHASSSRTPWLMAPGIAVTRRWQAGVAPASLAPRDTPRHPRRLRATASPPARP